MTDDDYSRRLVFCECAQQQLFLLDEHTGQTYKWFDGIVGNHVIGQDFFDSCVNGAICLDFPYNHFPFLLENVPLNIFKNLMKLFCEVNG